MTSDVMEAMKALDKVIKKLDCKEVDIYIKMRDDDIHYHREPSKDYGFGRY